jgi:hypothetical protein
LSFGHVDAFYGGNSLRHPFQTGLERDRRTSTK